MGDSSRRDWQGGAGVKSHWSYLAHNILQRMILFLVIALLGVEFCLVILVTPDTGILADTSPAALSLSTFNVSSSSSTLAKKTAVTKHVATVNTQSHQSSRAESLPSMQEERPQVVPRKAGPNMWIWDARWEGIVANFTTDDEMKSDAALSFADRVREKLFKFQKSPVVVKKYKFVFMPAAKVASTVWFKVLRRMEGFDDWNVEGGPKELPHHRRHNGLKYFDQFSPEEQNIILRSPDYVRAIYVRQPHERFLSAYLDKAVPNEVDGKSYVLTHSCCAALPGGESAAKACAQKASSSLSAFLNFTQTPCPNPHWVSQYKRVLPEWWPYINYVGYLHTAQEDAKQLFEIIAKNSGAANKDDLWHRYGASGWGDDGKEALFEAKSKRKGDSKTKGGEKLSEYFTSTELWDQVHDVYQRDYDLFFHDDQTKKQLFGQKVDH